MLVHHGLTFIKRQLVPIPGLDERVDEEVGGFGGVQNGPRPPLLAAHVDGAAGHGEVGVRKRQVGRHFGLHDGGGQGLEVVEAVSDLPEQQVGIAAGAGERITAHL